MHDRTPASPSAPHHRISLATTLFCFGLLAVVLLSSGPATSLAGGPIADASATTHAVSSVAGGSAGSSELASAAASLESGAGPAQGRPETCTNSALSEGSVSCQTQGPTSTRSSSPHVTTPSPEWELSGGPLATQGGTLVWDATDHYVLLYGTSDDDYNAAQTWAYANGTWTDVTPPVSPPARVSPYMAYDPVDGYVVLFGGWGGNSKSAPTTEYTDTWTYVGGVWTELHPKYSPTGRDSGAMAWDGKDGYLVIFGSYSGDNDTWSFVSGDWTEQIAPSQCTGPGGSEPCPLGVEDASMSYDPADKYVVLFGGSFWNGATRIYENDTWAYSGDHWTNLTCGAPTAVCTGPITSKNTPGVRENAMMTWDQTDGYLLVFGGYGHGDYEDTWKFLGGSWTELITSSQCSGGLCPSSRDSSAMTWDGAEGFVVLFGGYGPLSDMWKYEAGEWWILTQNTTPLAREQTSLVYDSNDGYVVMFGGNDGSPLGDTWVYKDGVWENATSVACATACPEARWGSNMTYDAHDGYVVLFGGDSASGDLKDTWTFSAGAWTELSPSTSPSARSGFSMAYDPSSEDVVLFGGDAAGVLQQDTWTFSSGVWTDLSITCTSSTCPSARTGASFTWDASDGYLLLFGGQTAATTYVNDTWSFTDAWTEISTGTTGACTGGVSCPSTRAGAQMAFDPSLGVVVLEGGATNTKTDSDTWFYHAGSWARQYNDPYPEARQLGSLVYDGLTGNLVLFGGWNREPLGDTWLFGNLVVAGTPYATPSNAIDIGQGVVFTATATGGGAGSSYTYLWQGLPPGCTASTPAATVSCAPTQNGTYYITTVAEDDTGAPANTSFFLSFAVNPDPVVVLSSTNSSVVLGGWANFTATMVGGTGTGSFLWSGLPPSCAAVSSGTLDCQPLTSADVGVWTVTVQAYDAAGMTSAPARATLTVLAASTPVVSVVGSAASVDLGQTFTLTASVAGGSGPPLFAWSGLPTGCAASSSSAVSCTPSASSDLGSWEVAVTASEASGTVVSSPAHVSVVVLTDPSASAPTSSRSALDDGQTVVLSTVASGGSGPYSYAWTGLPPGCGGSSSVLYCAPSGTVSGSFTPAVSVTDGNGKTASATAAGAFTVSTDPTVSAPSFTLSSGKASSSIPEGTSITIAVSVTGGSGGSVLAWSGLPPSCAPSSDTSTQISCAPNANGTYAVSVAATDTNGVSSIGPSATLAVEPPPAVPPVTAALEASPSVIDLGTSLTLTATGSGGTGTLGYAWENLPTGCAGSASATLSCTPSQPGSWSVIVTVSGSGGGVASAETVVTVNPALEITYVGVSSGSISLGASATFSVDVSGGSGTYTYAWTGLPAGCPAGNAAVLTCTPSSTGSSSVQVVVSDSVGGSKTSQSVALSVSAPTSTFAGASSDLDWTVLLLVVVVVVLLLVEAFVAFRRPRSPQPSSGAAPVGGASEGGAPPSGPSMSATGSPVSPPATPLVAANAPMPVAPAPAPMPPPARAAMPPAPAPSPAAPGPARPLGPGYPYTRARPPGTAPSEYSEANEPTSPNGGGS